MCKGFDHKAHECAPCESSLKRPLYTATVVNEMSSYDYFFALVPLKTHQKKHQISSILQP